MGVRFGFPPSETPVSKKTARPPTKKVRINLLMDRELRDWAKGYAETHHTTLTALFINHLVDLRREEDGLGIKQV